MSLFDYAPLPGLSSDDAGSSLDGMTSGSLGVAGVNCGGSGATGATGAAGATGAGAGDHEAGWVPFDER